MNETPNYKNRIKDHLCGCGRSKIVHRPAEPSTADKLLASASRVRIEVWRYDGELELEYEVRGSLGSIASDDDGDGDTVTLDDQKLNDFAGKLLRAFTAGKAGGA